MRKCKVLIADSDGAFSGALLEMLQENHTVKLCRDGVAARQLLPLFCPDILVVDMLLPGLDGITLLQHASLQECCPAVIATTGYCSDYIIDSAQRMGVSYLMRKPCTPEACAQRVEDLGQALLSDPAPDADPRAMLSNLLLQLGFSAKLKGYGFLREGILLYAKDTEQAVTKELYPAVARLFHSTGQRVERAIRSAIQNAWETGPRELWRSFFAEADSALPCPTNSKFIAAVADRLLLEKDIAF